VEMKVDRSLVHMTMRLRKTIEGRLTVAEEHRRCCCEPVARGANSRRDHALSIADGVEQPRRGERLLQERCTNRHGVHGPA
jgi:hypothetical protein